MLVKLKTIEQLKEEFKDCTSWNYDGNDLHFKIRIGGREIKWHINSDMLRRLGGVIEVRGTNSIRYTHMGDDGWYYHESWFVPYEFIEKKEFEL